MLTVTVTSTHADVQEHPSAWPWASTQTQGLVLPLVSPPRAHVPPSWSHARQECCSVGCFFFLPSSASSFASPFLDNNTTAMKGETFI